MELNGEAVLPAPPERVRSALQDREVMGRLLPGAKDLRPAGAGVYEGTVAVGVPPLVQRYPVRVTAEGDAAGLRLSAIGIGRVPLRFDAQCTLQAGEGGTTTHLRYMLSAELGPVGRLVGAAAGPRLIADFLAGLQAELSTGAAPRPGA